MDQRREKIALRDRPVMRKAAFARELRAQEGMMPTEISSDMGILRTMHSIELEEACGLQGLAHWCEWNHKHESRSSLLSQYHWLASENWPRFIRRGGVAIDVGAYSGDTAIPMAMFAYDRDTARRGTIVAVEPNPEVYKVLEINLRLNAHLADFRPVQAAITPRGVDEIEIADLGTSNCNMGIISEHFSQPLQDRLNGVTLNTFKVKGIDLASLIRVNIPRERIPEISFIKIDCEGFDKEIIASAHDVFSVIRPVIYTEWFGLFSADDSRELFRIIDRIDYVPLNPQNLLAAHVENKISDLMLVPREAMGTF